MTFLARIDGFDRNRIAGMFVYFVSPNEKMVLTPQLSRKSLKNSLKMSSKSIKMNDFSTGNQLERFVRFCCF